MRLVNVRTKCLENFYPDATEPYAVLSHTWGKEDEELSFQDMQALDQCQISKREKLDRSCEQACKDGFKYVWIDTCCIDKTNAVELSEAINSMFRWYQKAAICYAYLSDVPPQSPVGDSDHRKLGFCKSRWFTRGWTLQELLAPRRVVFFDSSWTQLGTKSSLSVTIGETTGIPHHILTGIASLQTCSVAQRMSWASRRTTTRSEDMAYCLLGIFNVMIPLLYGEGLDRAFGRLQEAIMKKTADDSILAWSLGSTNDQHCGNGNISAISGGILATSPAAFEGCGDIVRRTQGHGQTGTHIQGLDLFGGVMRISISLVDCSELSIGGPNGLMYGYLSCGSKTKPSLLAAIPLVQCGAESSRHSAGVRPLFLRPPGFDTIYLPEPSITPTSQTIWIDNDRSGIGDPSPSDNRSYWLYLPPDLYPWNAKLDEVYPAESFDNEMSMIKTPKAHEIDGDPILFLVRFSYGLDTDEDRLLTGHFILALEFFQSSASGEQSPRPYIFLDNQPSTPLAAIPELWPSLACSSATEVINALAPPVALSVTIGIETIDQDSFWMVQLSGIPSSQIQGPRFPPGWPEISEQVRLRTECCTWVHHVREETRLSRECERNTDDLNYSEKAIQTTQRELDHVNEEIARLRLRAEELEGRLESAGKHQTSLTCLAQSLNSQLRTTLAEVAEMSNSKRVRAIWPMVSGDKNSIHDDALWKEARRREYDGVIRHLMQSDPVTIEGKEMAWVPGITLLMYAMATHDPDFAKQIFAYDPDLQATDLQGRTALDWATHFEMNEVKANFSKAVLSKSPESPCHHGGYVPESEGTAGPQPRTKADRHDSACAVSFSSVAADDQTTATRTQGSALEQTFQHIMGPQDIPASYSSTGRSDGINALQAESRSGM